MRKLGIRLALGVGAMITSATLVYFMHIALNGETIPLALLLVSMFLVITDYVRRYFYIAGLLSYPLATAISVAIEKTQSLYPVIIFYELAASSMIVLGLFLGVRAKKWLDAIRMCKDGFNS